MSEYFIREETLKCLSNVIKEKAGISNDMTPEEMTREVYLLETPTDVGEPGRGVIFYDYDGTVLYTYTVKEARALTALPIPPAHDGITFAGWTHSLEQVNATMRSLDVGATYTSRTTKFIIDLESAYLNKNEVSIYFGQTVSGGNKIYWGDGSTTTVTGTGNVKASHYYPTYVSGGNNVYTLEIETLSGEISLGTWMNNDIGLFGDYGTYTRPNQITQLVIGAIIGNNFTKIYSYMFYYFSYMKTLLISQGISVIGDNSIDYCYALNALIIPPSVTNINDGAFAYMTNLKHWIMPDGNGLTEWNWYFFSNSSLEYIIVPSTISFLSALAFRDHRVLQEVHIRSKIPPTYGHSTGNIFEDCPSTLTIYVPAQSLDAYKTASGWSKHASQMKGEPVQYV